MAVAAAPNQELASAAKGDKKVTAAVDAISNICAPQTNADDRAIQ